MQTFKFMKPPAAPACGVPRSAFTYQAPAVLTWSAHLPHRRALLGEGGGAFHRVLGLEDGVEVLLPEVHRILDRQLYARLDDAHDGPDAERGARTDLVHDPI